MIEGHGSVKRLREGNDGERKIKKVTNGEKETFAGIMYEENGVKHQKSLNYESQDSSSHMKLLNHY